ncbi:ZnF_C2H2 [Nesidiocoris tenuis]|nr:ZnF_C2H2 [Nesidiocoris tenuis]
MGQLKRDHDEELYKCQVKKRRKQSKPIRIASTESPPDDSDGGKGELVTKSSDDALGYKQYTQNYDKSCKNESDEDGSGGENGNDSLLSDSDVKRESPFPLNLSHTKSPPPKDINGEPLSTANSEERNWYKAPTSVPTSIYPIPSFDLASIKSQVYPYNFLLPSQNPGPVPPNFKRIYVGNNENQVASPHRIFNPEAFCDLCNKEFCNKYFLKTHKANKHGIYTDIAATNSLENVPTLPLITYFSNNPANLPLPPTPVNKKSSGSFGSGSSKTNSSSMRAFCNICQREFCNKYFVRRHKAKIHGILENTEDTSQEYKPMIFNEKSDEMGLPGPSTGKMIADTQQNNNGGKDADSSFEEDGKLRKVKELENESEMGDSSQNALNFLVSSVQNEEAKESSKSPDRHKKFASNNSAFCDICCKEYCNKYFLRIHKQKCHGIVVNDKDEKTRENSGSGVVSSSTWRPDQPMPLNLILRETNQNGNDAAGANNTCNECDMTFPEPYLLKIHYNLVHNSKFSELKQLSNMNECQNVKTPYPGSDQNRNSSEPTNKCSSDVVNSPFHKNDLNEPKYLGSDVQRLHSMIIKLNQHNQQDSFVCDVCSRDFGKSSSLENHIIKDHAALLEEISNAFYEDNQNSLAAVGKWDNSKCQASFQNPSVMEMNLSDKHSLFDSKMSDRNGEESVDLGAGISMSGERSVVNTPTSSFCEICKKELCNKYFMKTHMQRMHGISIENGAHIGGVVCDICNKELCSKYFLRVHKQNSHGIVEEAFLPQVGNELKGPVPNTDFALKPSDHELSNRYFSHFTEVCSICSRRFRSVKWLKTHLLNDHGDEGKEKWKELQQQSGNKIEKFAANETPKKAENNYCCPSFRNSSSLDMKSNEPSTSYQQSEALPSLLYKSSSNKSYQCSYCSFTTSVLALLFVHERTHFANTSEGPSELQNLMSLSPKENEDIPNELTHQSRYPPNNMAKEHLMNFASDLNYPLGQMEKEGTTTNDDNKSAESKEPPMRKQSEAGMRCLKCPYTAQKLDIYLEHMQNEHKCENSETYLQIVRDALVYLASSSIIPASFALPSNNGSSNNYVMQPFIVEDKSNSTFVSSVVFLPVKEKLNAPVTAAFSLTPT